MRFIFMFSGQLHARMVEMSILWLATKGNEDRQKMILIANVYKRKKNKKKFANGNDRNRLDDALKLNVILSAK